MRIVNTPYGRGQVKGRNIVTAGGVKTVRLLVNILRADWRPVGDVWRGDNSPSASIWVDESEVKDD